MRKAIIIFFVVLFVALFGYTVYFLVDKATKKPIVYELVKPKRETVVLKTVATGTIIPRQEVSIKPQVSGIIDEIYVTAGQMVKKGQKLARIKIVPNVVNLNNAENNVNNSKINLEQAQKEYDRYKHLFEEKAVSEQELLRYQYDLNLRKEAYATAVTNYQLVKEGSAGKNMGTNIVLATISGMVLDVPVKDGFSVIERNNFNEGTTICVIANMNELIFEGKIDESEVGKIREGMEMIFKIGALADKKYKGELEFISPKGIVEDGSIKFVIKAKVMLPKGEFLRAGYSANADLVLEKRENVLTIKEEVIQYSNDTLYVEVHKGQQTFEKRLIKTGISDGVIAEVSEGLKENEEIKVPAINQDKDVPKKGAADRVKTAPRRGR